MVILDETQIDTPPVSLDDVRHFIATMGYQPGLLRNTGRHVVGYVQDNHKQLFFKLAVDPTISPRIRNEIAWYQQMSIVLNRSGLVYLDTPKVYQAGAWERKDFFFADVVPGHPLGDNFGRLVADASRFLPKIAKACAFLGNQSLPALPRDLPESNDNPANADQYHAQAEQWSDQSGRTEALRLRALALLWLEHQENIGASHGDLVPQHIFVGSDDIWLVGAEAGSAQAPFPYDASCLYHRLFTVFREPELAEVFKGLFRAELDSEDQGRFDVLFDSLLAFRTIRGWRDYARGDGTDLRLHQQLTGQLLAG